jgi:hypothetical protein
MDVVEIEGEVHIKIKASDCPLCIQTPEKRIFISIIDEKEEDEKI